LAAAFATGNATGIQPLQLVLALGFAAACLPVGAAIPHDPRSLFLVATFACVVSAFIRPALMLTPAPQTWYTPIDTVARGIFPEAFMPACLWQLALDFPRVRRFTAFDAIGRRAAFAAWLLGISLFATNALVRYRALSDGRFVSLLQDAPKQIFWHLLTLAIVPAIAAIFVR